MTPLEKYNRRLADKLIKTWEARNINGQFVENREVALKLILDSVPEGSTVAWGGSQTLRETGLIDALKKGKFNVLDASDRSKGGVEMNRLAHEALSADYYFLGANAISSTGEIVNVDGIGNRLSAFIYGPKNVIVVAGMNKVEVTLEQAKARARNRAAALVLAGYSQTEFASFDELIEKTRPIISQELVTTGSVFKGRVRVILVGESLGY
jgi:hypothetical protein